MGSGENGIWVLAGSRSDRITGWQRAQPLSGQDEVDFYFAALPRRSAFTATSDWAKLVDFLHSLRVLPGERHCWNVISTWEVAGPGTIMESAIDSGAATAPRST